MARDWGRSLVGLGVLAVAAERIACVIGLIKSSIGVNGLLAEYSSVNSSGMLPMS